MFERSLKDYLRIYRAAFKRPSAYGAIPAYALYAGLSALLLSQAPDDNVLKELTYFVVAAGGAAFAIAAPILRYLFEIATIRQFGFEVSMAAGESSKDLAYTYARRNGLLLQYEDALEKKLDKA